MRQKQIFTFFDKIDTEEKAYWLGFIYADGNITKKKDVFNLGLQIKDKNHLQKLASIFNKPIKISEEIRRGKMFQKGTLRVCSTYLCNSLISKGIIPRKTYIDSDVFCHVPDELLRHFIRGNMDGDGCICRFIQYGKIRYRVDFLGRTKFIKELEAIFARKFSEDSFYSTTCVSTWRLSICSASTILRVLDWLYSGATVFLERKHEKYLSLKRDMPELLKRGKSRNDSAIVTKAWTTRKRTNKYW